ncbi:MAG: DUF4190 domain-containing protein [Flavobacteriales bacterium]|nr:DUF4190 domain-containing protein [Flavobacteriales bacterium]MDW8410857.1 DUF4190 domain-containing protein [Flavobacteriales bacterium]
MKKGNILLLFFVLLSLTSCHIQRSLYTKRLHIQWIANDKPRVIEAGSSSESTHDITSFPTLWVSSDSTSPNAGFDEFSDQNPKFSLSENISRKALFSEGTVFQAESSRTKTLNQVFSDKNRKNIFTQRTSVISLENSPEYFQKESKFSKDGKKLEVMSLLSMIFAISGLFIPYLGFGLIVAGLVLGVIGLIKIQKNSDTYWGRGFAIAGIAVSGFAIFLLLILFTLLGSLFLLAV